MSTLTIDNMTLSDRDFLHIREIMYKHCGINLHEGKKELVRARLAKHLRKGNCKSFGEYLKQVYQDKTGRAFSDLVDSLSTNLTSFFREKQHFAFLERTLLPQLLQRKRQGGVFKIRAWSAGCSSGEEPYSMAITLLEAVRGQGCWDVKVLGTDISRRMLDRARCGVYESERVAPVSGLLKQRYLVADKQAGRSQFRVGQELRKTVILDYCNLMQNWPIQGPLDFIFCRNVMIYFDKATQQRLVNRFYDLLDDGGVLFTGHSESLTGISHSFRYVEPTIYRKST